MKNFEDESPEKMSQRTIVGHFVKEPKHNEDSNHRDPYLITITGDDLENPKNWTLTKRWYLTMASGFLVLNATFASSAPSGIFSHLVEEFHMSETVGVLTLSLFVCGYCVGPLLWGPLSEQYGRRPIFVFPFLVYAILQIGVALAPNTALLLILRFLSGIFAAAPLTNSGALISDIWDAESRGKALAIFTVAPFAGPALGPTTAGFIGENTTWRWVFWVLAAFAGLCWLMIVFTIPETYMPILLLQKAERMRNHSNEPFYAQTEREKLRFWERVEFVLARPFVIMVQEPMLIALTVYMSFVYGCLYLLFEAYPIVFSEGHHMSPGISGLMFIPIPLGGVLAVILYVMVYNPRYVTEAAKCVPKAVPPEFRLEMAFFAGPLFAVSFFWFAWTSFPQMTYWAPMLSGLLMGFSIQLIFLSLFNYLIDAYLFVAASALASSTVVRSIFGAAFPLFASRMYTSLGPQWASTLLGCIAITLVPIPFIFKRYGPVLRRKSKYCPTEDSPSSLPQKSTGILEKAIDATEFIRKT